MNGSTKLTETAIRYPIATGFLFFAAWRTLSLAGDIGFLKSTVGGPFTTSQKTVSCRSFSPSSWSFLPYTPPIGS
jgi:hypothetical protein